MLSESDYDVVIVGAGFAGLTTAYKLLKDKPGLNVLVLEANDRVGGRTHSQKMNCCDSEGKQTEYEWEFGGMWVSRTQADIMELLEELGIQTYDQYIDGMKCLQLDGDKKTRTYSSSIPPLGVLSTLDIGQALFRLERILKTINPTDPWVSPNAAHYDSMTAQTLVRDYCKTAKVVEMLSAGTRALSGANLSEMSALFFLSGFATTGSFNALNDQEYKIVGGSQNVCIEMINQVITWEKVKLNSPVYKLQKVDEGVRVLYNNKEEQVEIRTKYIVVAIPPHQSNIIIHNSGSNLVTNKLSYLYKHMPAGHLIKIIITYDKPYWKLNGFSGEVLTTDQRLNNPTTNVSRGCLTACLDATSDEGHPALVAFIGGDQAVEWGEISDEERKSQVLHSLSELFSCSELSSPVDYKEKNWNHEEYVGGCPESIMTPGAGKYYRVPNQITNDYSSRILFAGTEMSMVWAGYISGAVNTGKLAAKQILERLENSNVDVTHNKDKVEENSH